MVVTQREREAETQAEGEAGSMHREPDVGFDPGSPGSRPGAKAGAEPLRHPGIPITCILTETPRQTEKEVRRIYSRANNRLQVHPGCGKS